MNDSTPASPTTNLADLGWKHCPSCNAFLPTQHQVTTWCTGHYDTPAWQANERLNAKLELMTRALEQAQDCIRGETPEDCTPEEAREDTIQKIREALGL